MASKLEKELEGKGDEPFDPKDVVTAGVYNILSTLCFGHE